MLGDLRPVGWGYVETGMLVSAGLESDFLELVCGMGDPLKTYGEMACVGNR